MKKKICGLVLAFLLAVSMCLVSACNNGSGSDIYGEDPDGSGLEYVYENGEVVNLVSGGKSDYSIVIPETSLRTESYAATEMQTFIKEASLCTLPIVTDAQITAGRKFISIGNTAMFADTDIEVDYDELGESGIIIQTIGSNVFITGATMDAILYAVYQFLYYEIDFKAYAVDEVYYADMAEIPLYDFNIKFVPSVGVRYTAFTDTFGSDKLAEAARMYLIAGGNGGYNFRGNLFGGLWSHTTTTLIPPSTAEEGWYNNGQICLTKDAVVDAMAEALETYIDASDSPYLMIGHADTTMSCACETCRASIAIYGTGGTFVQFLNKVGEKVETYINETDPGRDLKIIGLAYNAYQGAPINVDANGNITPIDDSVICRSNVGICYAPLLACYSHAFDDPDCESNSGFYRNLIGWSKVTDTYMLYIYGTNFNNYMLYFNDFGSYKANAELYDSLNVKYILTQANHKNEISPFHALREYLQSQLWWDASQSYDALLNDFMDHYYKGASAEMLAYYEAIRNHWQKIYNSSGDDCSGIYDSTITSEWPIEALDYFLDILDEALEAVAQSDDSSEIKEKVEQRILWEQVFVRYMRYTYHSGYYSSVEYAEEEEYIYNFFEENGVTNRSEGGRI